jgi:hypothetical protein
MAKNILHGPALAARPIAAGLVTAEEIGMIRRMVFDFRADAMPMLYIERFVDDEVLYVLLTADGIEIRGAQT